MKCLQAWSSLRSHAAEGAQCERHMERSGCDISIKDESSQAECGSFTLKQIPYKKIYEFYINYKTNNLYR